MDLSFSKAEPLLRSFQLLARGPEQELVHIDVLRLAACEGNSPHTCLGRNRAFIRRAEPLGNSGSLVVLGSSVATALGEITVVRIVSGFPAHHVKYGHRA
jgi:hypothetical protein